MTYMVAAYLIIWFATFAFSLQHPPTPARAGNGISSR